ncbi:hypothetical protein C8R28_100124 [Nitrosomonas ureae]|uniref:Uncharacterized protein n=2 Tax=Nitrosomonas ureae TaxID=44577 RepID=A0A2T5IXD8_9PROT|nr:hypothetical protein C8R28_100124 [Nitrosomonas ureae]
MNFLMCIDNRGYEVSLELRKLYEVLSDDDAEKHGKIRVIDESGEDYLYPATAFTCVSSPENVIQCFISAHTLHIR